jgi:hypothetical protein
MRRVEHHVMFDHFLADHGPAFAFLRVTGARQRVLSISGRQIGETEPVFSPIFARDLGSLHVAVYEFVARHFWTIP